MGASNACGYRRAVPAYSCDSDHSRAPASTVGPDMGDSIVIFYLGRGRRSGLNAYCHGAHSWKAEVMAPPLPGLLPALHLTDEIFSGLQMIGSATGTQRLPAQSPVTGESPVTGDWAGKRCVPVAEPIICRPLKISSVRCKAGRRPGRGGAITSAFQL